MLIRESSFRAARTAGGPGGSSLSGSVGGAPISALAWTFAAVVWARTDNRLRTASVYLPARMLLPAWASAASARWMWVVAALAVAAVWVLSAVAGPAPTPTAAVSMRAKAVAAPSGRDRP